MTLLEKKPVHVWKETLSARPASRDTFRGMHLAVLHQATQQKWNERLLHIQFETHDFILCELKGHPKELTGYELPQKEEEILWLCLQFLGSLSFPSGKTSTADTFFSFTSANEQHLLTIPAGKQWALLLGLTGASRQQLLAEQPQLRKHYADQDSNVLPAVSLAYNERKLLEQFSKNLFGPFTTVHHIGLLFGKCYTAYAQQLDKQGGQDKDEGLIQLYHRAINYVTEHYMRADLNRVTIAEALHCSTRSLSRAFEGRTTSLNSSIILIRLYRARDLLKQKPEHSVEYIASMLHFHNTKHFATQYKKQFHRTPREERKKTLIKTM